jgi:hypothetical protein
LDGKIGKRHSVALTEGNLLTIKGAVKPSVHYDDGVSGIDWKHYKHPLPEHVYDVYMKYWVDVDLRMKS